MHIYNEEIYGALHEIADLMALLNENGFKIRAYRSAAENIRHSSPIKTGVTATELKKIPGVGDAISEKIGQYVRNKKIDWLEKLRASIPQGVRDLLDIPHLGPKRVRDLWIGLGVESKEGLIKKARAGEISALRGFGPKLTRQILEAISTGQEKKKRHPRREVEPIAKKLIAILKAVQGVRRVQVAGSFRRQAPDVGDLDILVLGEKVAPAAIKAVKKKLKNITLLAMGGTKISFIIFPQNLQVDIRFVGPDAWGAALLYFTGSKDYNVMMRKVAIEKSWMLNEYGLFDNQTGEQIAGRTEKEVCQKLGLAYQAPEKRK